MSSVALQEWRAHGLSRLAELEQVHTKATGPARGRRWSTTQLNRSLFVALAAQFQAYCRALHDDAVTVHAQAASPSQAGWMPTILTRGRKLDTQNARKATLGSDFGMLGIDLIADLNAKGAPTTGHLDALEVLVDFRNAIGHGNETKIVTLESSGRIRSTKASYVSYRRDMNALAATMDQVVAQGLAALLGIPNPW